jgi:hypothetical protein
MAKRTPTRSQTNDAAPATPAPPKARRSRGPSQEDIRMRAYQRYLQRGGSHGTEFEDWLEAERELKRSKA